MPTNAPAKSELAISRRANAFLKRTRTYAPALSTLFTNLRPLGEIVVFGGLLRSAALFGLSNFKSDIDLVIDSPDDEALTKTLGSYHPTRTSLGGYRLRVDSFQVDIWLLKSTWAFKKKLVQEVSVQNLIRTTFFNWDAIALSLESGRLFLRENYLYQLNNRFLDVVLPENPNPAGMVARAVKLWRDAAATLSPALVNYLVHAVEGMVHEWQTDRADSQSEYRTIRAISPLLEQHRADTPDKALCMHWQQALWDDGIITREPNRSAPRFND